MRLTVGDGLRRRMGMRCGRVCSIVRWLFGNVRDLLCVYRMGRGHLKL